MKATRFALVFLGLMAVGTATGFGTSSAHAQYYGGKSPSYGRGYSGPRHVPRRPGYGFAAPRGYSFSSSYYGGGRYGRPWGYSSSFGYAPGFGSYYGSSYYSRGFSYSSYGSYFR